MSMKLEPTAPSMSKAFVVRESRNIFNADVVQLPTSLTLITEVDTAGACFSACHTPDGNILVACRDGLKVFNEKISQSKMCQHPKQLVVAAIEHHRVIYLLLLEGDTWKVKMCLPDCGHADNLFEFEGKSKFSSSMTVSDSHIVAYNVDAGELIVYDMATRVKTKHEGEGRYPYFLSDRQLLISGHDQLVKYTIEDNHLTETWTFDQLPDIRRVCTSSDGIIFVLTGKMQGTLFFFSENGELLGEIQHDKLSNEFFGQISLKNGELAVPGWDDKKLYIFKVNYSTGKKEEKPKKGKPEDKRPVSEEKSTA